MKIYRIENYKRQSAQKKERFFQNQNGTLAKAAGAENMVFISDEAIEMHERDKRERFEKQREQNIRDILTRRLVYGMTKGIDDLDIDDLRARFEKNSSVDDITGEVANILLSKLFFISH